MSMTQHHPTIKTEIDAARARWAKKRAARDAEAAEAAARDAALAASRHQKLLQGMGTYLPEWMLEYVRPNPRNGYDVQLQFVSVLLPGCAPIDALVDTGLGYRLLGYKVGRPLRVAYDDDASEWYAEAMYDAAEDLDQVIDLAASYGDSYHEMAIEAARRNTDRLHPQPAPPTTALDDAGDALNCARRDVRDGDPDYGQAIALLAIAEAIHALIEVVQQGR